MLGIVLVIDNAPPVLTSGGALADGAGLAVGTFAIGAGALGGFRPERLPRGAEPASAHLYVIAAIATLAFVFWTVSM